MQFIETRAQAFNEKLFDGEEGYCQRDGLVGN